MSYPEIIRGYELEEVIGQGGFGAVFRAHQRVVEREVAIKVILPQYVSNPDFIRGFETEARLIARLEHPFIVPLFDYWRDPEGAYLVMRYFSNGSLKGMIKAEGKISLETTARMLSQMAGALDTAHRFNVIHRDIKPANILLDRDSNAYLADFGIAQQLEPDSETTDDADEFSGTIAYSAPELFEGKPATPFSDIYALGLVVYHMLAGEHPYHMESTIDMVKAHILREIPDIPDVPAAVNEALKRATAKTPDARYHKALDFALAFQNSIGGGVDVSERLSAEQIMNPYKGLRAFEEADAQDFFGREALVSRLISELQKNHDWHQFLAVVGPSGSGKSSVVHAGLVPALRDGNLTGADRWFIVNMVPSAQPLHQLSNALLSIAVDPADTISRKLRSDAKGLIQAVENVLGDNDQLLLVIDQFEEVFTLVEDENERRQLLDLLHTAISTPDSRLWIVITLRADFYDKPLLYEEFGALMQARTQVILPLSTGELQRAITGPAHRVGLEVDTDLAAAIVADVREEPGALPLLQYALTEVFERRDGHTLTLAAYRDSGGVLGALARRAEEVFTELPPEQQLLAEQIFLRLVTLGEGAEDTRRRVRYSELTSFTKDVATLQAVLDTFGKYRLLTFDRDPDTREPTIEVAHEALIREWKRLRQWLDNNRNDIRLQRMVAAAASDWFKAERDSSYLLTGTRLAQFEDWSKDANVVLGEHEAAFLDESTAERQRQEQIESERQEQQLTLERRARQRLQLIVGILVIASIIGIGLTVAVFQQSREAQDERDEAQDARDQAISAQATSDASANEARSLTLSTQAQQAFSRGDTTLSLMLALEAVRIPGPPEASFNTLLDIAYGPGVRNVLHAHQDRVSAIAISPDGTLAVSGVGVNVFARATGAPPPPGGPPGGGPPPGGGNPPPPQSGGVPIPGEIREQSYPADDFVDNHLALWNLETGEKLLELNGHQGPVSDILFAPDLLVSASLDGTVIFWDMESGDEIDRIELTASPNISLSLDESGEMLLITLADGFGQQGEMIVWDVMAAEEINRFRPQMPGLWEASITPDGAPIVATYWGGSSLLLDAESGEETGRFEQEVDNLQPNSFHTVLSSDGFTAATAGPNGNVIVWDIETLQIVSTFSPPFSQIRDLAFDDEGLRIYLVSDDGTLSEWDVETGRLDYQFFEARSFDGVSVAVNTAAEIALIGHEDGSIYIWELFTLPARVANEYFELDLMSRARFVNLDDTLHVLSFGGNWGEFNFQPQLQLWNALTSNPVELNFPQHDYMSFVLAVSDDNNYALSGTSASAPGIARREALNRLVLWNIGTGETAFEIEYEQGMDVHAAAFDPSGVEGQLRIASSWGRDIRLWDVASGEVIQIFTGHERNVQDIVFSDDGQTLISVGDDDTIRVWDVLSGEERLRIELEGRSPFVLLSDEGIITAQTENHIALWSLEDGSLLGEFVGHEDFVESAALSDDGQYLLSGSADNSAIIWDLATRKIVQRFPDHFGRIWDVDFSPDNEYILTVSDADGVIVWRVNLPTLDEARQWIADNRYTRPYTPQECEDFRLDC